MSRLIAAALSVFVAANTSPVRAEWLEARSPHFVVYADMPEKDLRLRVQRLEHFDAALRNLFNPENEDRATIYVLGSMAEIQKLANDRNVGGFYRSTAQGSEGFVPERLPFELPGYTAESILFHEYTHHMLLSNLKDNYPGWVHEGLAELFSTARFADNGDVIVGAPNEARGWAMNGLSRWTVKRLIISDDQSPKGDERIERYSRSWALLHYLIIGDKRPGQYFKFIAALNEGKAPLEAAQGAFGDLDKLNADVNAYLRGTKLQTKVIPARTRADAGEISFSRLSDGHRAILPFRLRSTVGVGLDTALPLAQAARPVSAAFPADPFVQRTMTEIEYDAAALAAKKRGTARADDFAAADAAADRTLDADKDNVMGMIYKGRIAAMIAVGGDKSKWAEARRWFVAANRLRPDYALPLQLYYESFLAAGAKPTDAAVLGMRRAVVLAPADLNLRSQLGIELVRRGELEDAEQVLGAVAFNPHSGANDKFVDLLEAVRNDASAEALERKIAELKLGRLTEFSLSDPTAEGEETDARPVQQANCGTISRC